MPAVLLSRFFSSQSCRGARARIALLCALTAVKHKLLHRWYHRWCSPVSAPHSCWLLSMIPCSLPCCQRLAFSVSQYPVQPARPAFSNPTRIMHLADLAQFGRPSRNTRKLRTPSGEGCATAISDWANTAQTASVSESPPSQSVRRDCGLQRPSPFAPTHPLSYLACAEYPEEFHNSTVSSESVDAPTLACLQGTISDHGPPPLCASVLPTSLLPTIRHLYTDKPRSTGSQR